MTIWAWSVNAYSHIRRPHRGQRKIRTNALKPMYNLSGIRFMMLLPFICLLMFYVCSHHVVMIDTAHIISISFRSVLGF